MAIYKTPITVILSALGSLTLGLFLIQPPFVPIWLRWIIFGIFIISTSLSVFVNIMPRYYERIQIASNLLPVIFNVFGLDSTSRLTIHHIQNRKSQTYEQITDYYPTNSGRGRRFVFTQGITGQAFRTQHSHIYSIPTERNMKEDYQTRWAFTEDEISRLSQDRKSFYAYPIGQEGNFAKIVIYFEFGKRGNILGG